MLKSSIFSRRLLSQIPGSKFPLLKKFQSDLWNVAISPMDFEARLMTARFFIESLPEIQGYRKRFPDSEEALNACIEKLGNELIPEKTTVEDLLEKGIFYEEVKDRIFKGSDLLVVQKSFTSTKFQNPKASDELYEEIQQLARKWISENLYYAPYTALVNASMTGKSRLLTELRKNGVFLFYICLRSPRGAGFWPPRTPHIADWATKPDAHLLDFTLQTCMLLQASLDELCSWLAAQPQNEQRTKGALGEGVSRNGETDLTSLTESWYEYTQGANSLTGAAFWNRVTSRVKATGFNREDLGSIDTANETDKAHALIDSRRAYLLGSVSEFGNLLKKRGIPVDGRLMILYVVDETKELTETSGHRDRFAWFRRALSALPRADANLPLSFCVMTDTTSRVANLIPARALDPSFRVRDPKENTELFQPCSVPDSLDVWWHAVNKLGDINILTDSGRRSLSETLSWIREKVNSTEIQLRRESFLKPRIPRDLLESFEFMALFGRAAYYAQLHRYAEPLDAVGIDFVVKQLQMKLLRQDPNSEPLVRSKRMHPDDEIHAESNTDRGRRHASSFTQVQALAVLGAIASIDISASSKMASELSAGHMRLLGAISDKRQFVYTLEVSEPPLAFAAHALIINGKMPWFVIIDKLASSLVNNSTVAGYQGEVAAQILLLMAWQKIVKWSALKFSFVPVSEYLEVIVGGAIRGGERQLEERTEHLADLPERDRVREAQKIQADRESLIRARMEFDEVKCHLTDGFVRVYQFVKALKDPNQRMLIDYMLRGSGIRCKDGQPGIDLLTPLRFGPASDTVANMKEDPLVSSVLWQIKLYGKPLKPHEKLDITEKLREAKQNLIASSAASKNSAPYLGICLDLDPTAKKHKTVEIRKNALGEKEHIIFISGLSPSDVFPDDPLTQQAFERFLITSPDPAKGIQTLTSSPQKVKRVFRTQPYSDYEDFE